MALFRIRLVADQVGALPQDRVNWGFGIDADDTPSNAEMSILNAGVVAALADTSGGASLSSLLQPGMIFRASEAYPAAGGEAVATASDNGFPYTVTASGALLPSEVAVCLSHRIDGPRGVGPRGRTYIGPLSANANSAGRPSAFTIGACNAFGRELNETFILNGWTWVVISADGTASRGEVLGVEVDNAFDTQRRRGWERTSRTVLTFP